LSKRSKPKRELEKYLKDSNIKWFDYSEFSEPEIIGSGGCANVYSATFQGKEYALKSLKNNLSLDYKQFKQFKREVSNILLFGI
ncbi:6505_t:CDS:2, partial [Racocetra fulgida]